MDPFRGVLGEACDGAGAGLPVARFLSSDPRDCRISIWNMGSQRSVTIIDTNIPKERYAGPAEGQAGSIWSTSLIAIGPLTAAPPEEQRGPSQISNWITRDYSLKDHPGLRTAKTRPWLANHGSGVMLVKTAADRLRSVVSLPRHYHRTIM